MSVDISPKRPPMSSWTAFAPSGSGSEGGGSSVPSRSMRRIMWGPPGTAWTGGGATRAPRALRRGLGRELPARRVDVTPAREPHRRAQPVLLERGLEGVDRGARGALVNGARRVVRDQVELVDPRVEQPGELDGLAVGVVDPREHHVLDEDAALAARVVALAGLEHLGQGIAVVDRHDPRPQRV